MIAPPPRKALSSINRVWTSPGDDQDRTRCAPGDPLRYRLVSSAATDLTVIRLLVIGG